MKIEGTGKEITNILRRLPCFYFCVFKNPCWDDTKEYIYNEYGTKSIYKYHIIYDACMKFEKNVEKYLKNKK